MCERPLSRPQLSPDPHSSVLLETLDSTLLSLQSLRGDEKDGRRRYHGGGGGRALLRPSWKEEEEWMSEDPEMVPGLPSVAGDEEVEEAVGTAEEEAEAEDESLFMILLPRYNGNIFLSK